MSSEGQEFGEERLVDALESRLQLPVPEILDRVTNDVRRFGGREQQDDITLVVARCL